MDRRQTPYFHMDRVAAAHGLDDVQVLLIQDVERLFCELWPSPLRPPDALNCLFISVCTLIDWTSRSPKGRALMRKRILRLIAAQEGEPAFGPNNLAENEHALQVVPGILGAILGEEETEDLDPGADSTLADLVEAWLNAGGDGVAEG